MAYAAAHQYQDEGVLLCRLSLLLEHMAATSCGLPFRVVLGCGALPQLAASVREFRIVLTGAYRQTFPYDSVCLYLGFEFHHEGRSCLP